MKARQARIVLGAAVLAAHGRSLGGAFQYDDFNVIVHNPTVHDLTRWHHGLRPLLKLTYALNWAVDTEAFGFLAVNVAIHLLNAGLVFELLRKLLPDHEDNLLPALCGALAFGLHPVQTEAVAYVCGRSASLMATFFLGSLLFTLKAREAPRPALPLSFALLCFLAAVLTKETALVLPALLLLLPRNGGPAGRRATGALLGLGALLVAGLLAHPAYRRLLGYSFGLRDLAAQVRGDLRGLAYLGGKLLWPTSLNIDPPLRVPEGWTPATLAALAGLALLVGIAVAARRRRPWLARGLAWILLTLLPVLGPVPRLDLANERFLYLPLVGVAWLVAGLCLEPALKRWAPPVALALAALLALGTHRRIQDYRTEAALWESSLRADPANARALNNLGTAYALEGRKAEAREAYRRALELRPDYALARENLRGLSAP